MRLLRSLLAACAVVTAVASCSSEDEPGTAPTAETSSPAASPSPSGTSAPPAVEPSPSSEVIVKPELPPEATVPDAAGAEAFTRHFWDVANYAYASGDTAALAAISEEDCQGCIGLKVSVETATNVGATWVSMTWATEQYESDAPDARGISLVSALMLLSEDAHVIEADGTRKEITGARIKSFQALVEWRDDQWRAFEIQYPDDAP